jgi:hypothetical protein
MQQERLGAGLRFRGLRIKAGPSTKAGKSRRRKALRWLQRAAPKGVPLQEQGDEEAGRCRRHRSKTKNKAGK